MRRGKAGGVPYGNLTRVAAVEVRIWHIGRVGSRLHRVGNL